MTPQTPVIQTADGEPFPYHEHSVAERYEDLAKRRYLFPRERRILEEWFEPGGRVLDLGCGCGRTTRVLADRGFDVTGVDVSEAMVDRGADLFPDLDIRQGDATELEFAEGEFDYVLFSYVGLDSIRPERARQEALTEIHRVLAYGGLFAFSSHNRLYTLPACVFDRGYLRNFFLENGNWDRIGARYKADGDEFGVHWYVGDPLQQRRQLRRHGFSAVELVGKRRSPARYFERQPYYVARKSHRPNPELL